MKKNKIKLAALLFAVVLTVFGIGAHAEEPVSEVISQGKTDGGVIGDEAYEQDHEQSTVQESNVFVDVYNLIIDNSDKIFALLAFSGSALVGFTYKKGLLPLLKSTFSSLTGSVSSIKERSTELAEHTNENLNELCEKMNYVLKRNEETDKSVECISERLTDLCEVTEQYRKTHVVLASQIDMLYAIFMSSALPQYQKEEVSERIKQMKGELAIYDKAEE